MEKFDRTRGSASVEVLEYMAMGYPIDVEVCCYCLFIFFR
jgi:hypothetical protein